MAKKSEKTLIKEYNKLATTLDKRQQRLEQISGQKNFKHVKEWAYKKINKVMKSWFGEKAKGFRRKPPVTDDGKVDRDLLSKRIKEMKRLMKYPSGTKRGIVTIYKKRADTLNRNHGTDFKWEDLADFFESSDFEKNQKDYGSDTYVSAIGVLQENEKQIIKAIKEKKDLNFNIDDDKVEEAVSGLLSKYGKKFTDLYK